MPDFACDRETLATRDLDLLASVVGHEKVSFREAAARYDLARPGANLTKHWAFKHAFLHACQHRPKQSNASGQRELVLNRGLAAVTLILLIAAAASLAFVLRHSKFARRHHLTAVAVAAQLRAWVSKAPPSIRAPD